MTRTNRKEGWPIWLIALIAVSIVIFLWWAGAIYMWSRFPNANDRGTAGDSFGGITALFSGLAFAGLIVTLVMQRRELELQRLELGETREVMREQVKHIKKQNVEATFFKMVENFYSLIEAIDYDQEYRFRKRSRENYIGSIETKVKSHTGRDALKFFAKSMFYSTFKTSLIEYDDNEEKEEPLEEGWEDRYLSSYYKYETDLAIYFIVLYTLIRYIDDNKKLTKEQKYKYIKTVRASLSSNECALIFMNGDTVLGRDNMKILIEKYAILKHTPEYVKKIVPFVTNRYESSAFGSAKLSK